MGFLDILNKAKKEGETKLKVIAPNYTPPTSSNNNTSSSSHHHHNTTTQQPTQPTQPTQAEIIKEDVTRGTANQNVQTYEQGRITAEKLGVGQSTNNPLVDRWISNQKTQTGSYVMPGTSTIIKEEEAGNISTGTAMKGLGMSLTQGYQDIYNRDTLDFNEKLIEGETKKFNTATQYYQGRIDAGEDFDTVNKEYEGYINTSNQNIINKQTAFNMNWEKTKGANFKAEANKILFDTNLLYNSKEAKGKTFSNFEKGAITNAGITGGFIALSKYIPTTTKVLGKASLPVMAVYYGVAYAKSGIRGYTTYKKAKGLGFTNTQSLQRATLSGGNTLSGPAFFGLGGLAGGLAVGYGVRGYQNLRTTGRVTGYSSAEQGRINKLLTRENAFKPYLEKGKVGETQIKSGGSSVKGTTTSRGFNVKLNKGGLAEEDVAIVKKFNLRGKVYQNINSAGKGFSGIEAGKFKTGGYFGRTTTTFTSMKGVVNNGKVSGLTSSLSQTGRTYEFTTGAFTGKGTVKYPTSLSRIEGSNIKSQNVFRATYLEEPTNIIQFGRPQKNLISYSAESGPVYNSKIGIGSKLTNIQNFKWANNNIAGVGRTKTFTDVSQFFPAEPLNFDVTRTPSTKSYTTGGSGQVQITQQANKFIPPAPTSISQINVPKFQSSAGKGFVSAYAGTGQYETTQSIPQVYGGIPQVYGGIPQVYGGIPQVYGGIPQANLLESSPQTTITGPQVTNLPTQNSGINQGYQSPTLTSIQTLGTTQKPIQNLAQQPNQMQNLRQGQLQASKISQNTPLANPPITTGGNGWRNPTTQKVTPFPLIPLPSMIGGPQAVYGGIPSRKRKSRYTPSISALFFKIKGSQPKRKQTGFNFRPITTKRKKKKKIRLVKKL